MSTQQTRKGFKKMLAALAVLGFAAFFATAEAETEGTADTNPNAGDVKASGQAPMFPCMDKEFFESLDANDDGVLSLDEMPARPRFARRGMGRRGFARMDANNDDALTFEEASALRFMDEERFQKLDANNDGALSRNEMPARRRFGRHGKGRRGAGWLDADSDGTVTLEEASAPRMSQEHFKMLDANNDGVLSEDEMPARPRRFGRRGMGRRAAGWTDDDSTDKGAFVPPCMDEEAFKRLDSDNDGVLSQDEFSAGPRFGRRGMGRQ
jgi:Ca2+-binding EF-hand superfamily protein